MKKVLLGFIILISSIFANKNTTFKVNPFADISYDISTTEYSDVNEYIYLPNYTGWNSSIGLDLYCKPLFLELQVGNLLQFAAYGEDLFPLLGIGLIKNINNNSFLESNLSYTNNLKNDTNYNNYYAFSASIGYYYFLNSISSGVNIGIINRHRLPSWNTNDWWYNKKIYIFSEFTYHTKYLNPYITMGLIYSKEYYENYPGFFSIGLRTQLKDFHSTESQTKLMYYRTRTLEICKPNIYLYPESSSQVNVTLSTKRNNKITSSIPEYNNGWDVSIDPSGLIDKNYQYLFYEGKLSKYPKTKYGWSVAYSDLWNFLPEKMTDFGFNQKEIKDFVDYWQAHLPKSEFYVIVPIINHAVEKEFSLKIQPKPDNVLRAWFYIIPAIRKQDITPPRIPKFNRNGFTVTEWGVILNKK
jgi:hypothetical protein